MANTVAAAFGRDSLDSAAQILSNWVS